MKPFIKIGDSYVNIASILYIETLPDGNVWVAFDLNHQQGIRVTDEQATTLKIHLGPLVLISV